MNDAAIAMAVWRAGSTEGQQMQMRFTDVIV